MNGQEAIIAEILSVAQNKADALISDAEATRDESLENVRREQERKKSDALRTAQNAAEEVAARSVTLGKLEARKIELSAKQQAIDAAFAEAERKVSHMTDHIYRDFMASLIKEYAEDGDRVVIAAGDTKRLHAEWLQSVSKACGKSLTLSSETHNGSGGVILCGERCDKNLTLETLFAALREERLGDVAKRLFG